MLLKRVFFISVIVGQLSMGAQAQEQPSSTPTFTLSNNLLKKTEAEITSSFRAYSFDERQDKSQLVQLFIAPSIKMELHKTLQFRAKGSLSLNTARIQTRFEDPSFNTINLNELILAYEPWKYLTLEAGALSQDQLNAPLLISERSFPGAMIKSAWVSDKFAFTFKAQYSIPNSVSLESDRTDNEALPSFMTQGFDLEWTPKDWVRFTSSIHHFTYQDLPSIVAFQSGRLGNKVIGEDSSESFFAYDFDGFAQSYKLSLDYSAKIRQHLNLQIVENLASGVPRDRNRSQLIGTALDIYTRNLVITPTIGYFYAESDSAPALYSAVQFGRNNREGMLYGLRVHFQDLGFALSANYVQANLIEDHPIQNNLNAFEFLVELPSVRF